MRRITLFAALACVFAAKKTIRPKSLGGDGDEKDGGERREVPLLPRWPLGSRDERATGETKSSKKKRMAAPLTPAGGEASDLVAPGIP